MFDVIFIFYNNTTAKTVNKIDDILSVISHKIF